MKPQNSPAEHSIQFPNGKLVVKSPCNVGKEAFTALDGGNKFCSQCRKVVHNLHRLTESEIKAIFAANEGNVCGSIRILPPAEAMEPIRNIQTRKPIYLKHLAAAASIFLIVSSPNGQPLKKPAVVLQDPRLDDGNLADATDNNDWKTNTLVTGVILNQDSELVPLDIPVLIFANQKLIKQIKSRNGLFTCDLGTQLKPESVIEIVIREHHAYPKSPFMGESYGGGKKSSRLGDAQNLTIQVQYEIPRFMIEGGMGWEETVPSEVPVDAESSGDLVPNSPNAPIDGNS